MPCVVSVSWTCQTTSPVSTRAARKRPVSVPQYSMSPTTEGDPFTAPYAVVLKPGRNHSTETSDPIVVPSAKPERSTSSRNIGQSSSRPAGSGARKTPGGGAVAGAGVATQAQPIAASAATPTNFRIGYLLITSGAGRQRLLLRLAWLFGPGFRSGAACL